MAIIGKSCFWLVRQVSNMGSAHLASSCKLYLLSVILVFLIWFYLFIFPGFFFYFIVFFVFFLLIVFFHIFIFRSPDPKGSSQLLSSLCICWHLVSIVCHPLLKTFHIQSPLKPLGPFILNLVEIFSMWYFTKFKFLV